MHSDVEQSEAREHDLRCRKTDDLAIVRCFDDRSFIGQWIDGIAEFLSFHDRAAEYASWNVLGGVFV